MRFPPDCFFVVVCRPGMVKAGLAASLQNSGRVERGMLIASSLPQCRTQPQWRFSVRPEACFRGRSAAVEVWRLDFWFKAALPRAG